MLMMMSCTLKVLDTVAFNAVHHKDGALRTIYGIYGGHVQRKQMA